MKPYKAPVVITVYDRSEHFKKCIDSLVHCDESSDTSVYIGMDAPVSEEAKIKQREMLSYLEEVKGFKYIKVITPKRNVGALLNSQAVIKEVLLKYDRFIRTEDDNVFSKNFLTIMNEMLEICQKDKQIFAICGYSYPKINQKSRYKNFFIKVPEFYSWGYATWKERYEKFEMSNFDIFRYLASPVSFINFIKNCNSKVIIGLVSGYFRKRRYNDYFICAYINKRNLRCLIPYYSLVRNTGQDGSGLNSGKVDVLMNQEICSDFFIPSVKESERINKHHRSKRDEFFMLFLNPRWKLNCFFIYVLVCLALILESIYLSKKKFLRLIRNQKK